MPHTVEQEREFKTSFAARRRRQYLVAIPFVVVLVALALVSDPDSMDLFGVPPTIWGPAFAGYAKPARPISARTPGSYALSNPPIWRP